MNFTDIIYQSALFTATFFVCNQLFSRFVFNNREATKPSIVKIVTMFLGFTVYAMIVGYFIERNATPVSSSEQSALASGQSMTAPVSSNVATPLKLDFDFAQAGNQVEQLTTVKTKLAEYTFSSEGATLNSVVLLWQDGTQKIPLFAQGAQHFAVAFDQAAPMAYKLVKNETLSDGNLHELVYQAPYQHGTIQKRFVLHQDTYQIDLDVQLDGVKSTEQIRLLMPTPKSPDELVGIVNAPTATDRIKLTDIALDNADSLQQFWFEPKLFGFSTRFFTTLCFKMSPQALGRVYLKKSSDNQYQAVFESKPCHQDAMLSWSFYCGPKTSTELHAVAPELTSVIRYGILSPLAKPLANLLVYTKEKSGNYGLAIILVALLLKLLMLPFTLRSERSMRQQAEFEKKRVYLQQKFKHDKAALDQATAELIQKHGLPIFSGCLPMLLNIPVFIALNKVLTGSTELYGASFLWLPDLSASDPYYILSMLTFVGMIFAPGIQTGPRQMFSRIGFALFLAAVTSYLASGLALFVVLNTLFGVVQSFAIRKIRWLSARYA